MNYVETVGVRIFLTFECRLQSALCSADRTSQYGWSWSLESNMEIMPALTWMKWNEEPVYPKLVDPECAFNHMVLE